MTTTGLIPRNRLRWIPKAQRLAHEYCYFLHDRCVEILREYEKEGAHQVQFTFKDKAEAQEFERIAASTDSVNAMLEIGLADEARRVMVNTVTMAMVSDCLHHVFEALRCLEKRKFIVALNLLRKPLLDSLIFLSWMLGDEDGFHEAFTRQSPDALSANRVGNQRAKILSAALNATALPPLVEASEIHAALFEKTDVHGLYWLMQRAVHLVTTQHAIIRTEPENFNFIFKAYTDDDVYISLYDTLPVVLLYLSHVIIELFDRMHEMDPGAKLAFRTRTTFAFHLVEKTDQVPEIVAALSTLSEHFQCVRCETHPRFTLHNAGRAVMSESFRCSSCGTVNAFPFAWLF